MLGKVYIPRVIPSRIAACLICSGPVVITTNPRKCCEACKIERKRLRARESMERQRRKRGVPLIKDTFVPCKGCGLPMVRNRRPVRYCSGCYLESTRERSRRVSAERKDQPEGYRYINEWFRKRRKSDPAWRVSSSMRSLMHKSLRTGKQGRSWLRLVPYTLAELMSHLERQFLPGMTWEKVGPEIHIDHIVPLSSFKFVSAEDPEFKAAWALTNLRPLWASENIRKSNQRIFLL